MAADTTSLKRLQQLQRRFLAANLRSRSLRLTRPTRTGAIDLHTLLQATAPLRDTLLPRLGRPWDTPIKLLPCKPSTKHKQTIANHLGDLHRAARNDWMETGAKDLAVGWPLLEGCSADGTWLRGPLLLYPAELDTSSSTAGLSHWTLTLTGPPELNEGLATALWRTHRIGLTLDALLQGDQDGILAMDADSWRDLHHSLRDLGLGSPGDGPLPPLSPWQTRTKQDRTQAPKGTFELHHQAAIGRFPRSGSSIILDYDQLLQDSAPSMGLAQALLDVDEDAPWALSTPLEDAATPQTDTTAWTHDARRWQVLPSDSSQDAVFNFLARDKAAALVVQGPPGTGKSQMITNLVASSIARGWRVLLVCQKRAALDVVADRLASLGIRRPVAVVHDVTRDRNAVCEAIALTLGQIRHDPGTDAATNPQQDAAQRAWDTSSVRLQAHLDEAQRAWTLLATPHHDRPALATLQQRALDDDGRPLPDLKALADVTETQALGWLPRLAALAHDSTAIAAPHPLYHRTWWGHMAQSDLDTAFDTLDQIRSALLTLQSTPGHLTPKQALDQNTAWALADDLLNLLSQQDTDATDEFLLFWFWTGGQTRHGEWSQVMETLRHGRQTLVTTPSELVTTHRDTLQQWQDDLARLDALARRWYRFFLPEFWRLRTLPAQILERCKSLAHSPALVKVTDLCKHALGWHDFILKLPADNPVLRLGFTGTPNEIDDEIRSLQTQHDRVKALHQLHQTLQQYGGPYAQMPELDPTEEPTKTPFIRAALADRKRATTLSHLRELIDSARTEWDTNHLNKMEALASNGDLTQALELLDGLMGAKKEAELAWRLDKDMSDQPPPQWVQHFLKHWHPSSLKNQAADPITDATTALGRAWRQMACGKRSARQIERPLLDPGALDALGDALDTNRQASGLGIMAQYQHRLQALVTEGSKGRTLRKLEHEVSKRRNRATLRQLVERFWDHGLDRVRPAWFCSPDSVAALFPLQRDLFDLIIFDEASQCPVEAAVPALVRARRAIIAGDDQQMPPSHFFRANGDEEDDDDESTVLASRSLLALARVAFPDTTLRWHYRSQHEALMAFSNAAFYGDRLITAPRRQGVENPDIEGLGWVQVPGLWQEQRNTAEARRVVELIQTTLSSDDSGQAAPTIGVVTFNRKQAELIENLLQDAARNEPMRALMERNRRRPAVEQLFIRNLENVQGDERDVIIFSVGYGPNTQGAKVHARFGPLGQEGGEKRLNVAITRARRGIRVVCSFDPDTLQVANTRHPGPRLLKRYLQFVKAHHDGQQDTAQRLLTQAAELGGGQGVTGSHRAAAATHKHGQRVRQELAQALQAQGLRVQVGLGMGSQRLDLAVGLEGEEVWRLGIDCSEFLANPDPMARDIYTPRFWERLGWRVLRVSPAMWLHERQATLELCMRLCQQSA